MNKIIIFCGEDLVSSRKAFLEQLESLRKDNYEIERISGKDLTIETLELLSSPTSLFGEKKAMAIENLLGRPKSKEKEKIIEKIVSLLALSEVEGLSCYIVIWENKELSKSEQQKFPTNFVFKNFKLPGAMFAFLEMLVPGKTKMNLENLKAALEISDPNFLFLMLVRQIRLLILAKNEKDILKVPPWQKGKLQRQSKAFAIEKLLEINKSLLQIDYDQKTSGSPFDLSQNLELFVTKI